MPIRASCRRLYKYQVVVIVLFPFKMEMLFALLWHTFGPTAGQENRQVTSKFA